MTTVIVYAHDIEPPLARWCEVPQIVPRDLSHLPPLMPVYGGFGSFHIPRSASFNLHKTKHIAIPPDQVNLATTARRSVVPGYHHVAEAAQMEVCVLFTANTEPQVGGPLVRRQKTPGQQIEAPDDDSGYPGGKHNDTSQTTGY